MVEIVELPAARALALREQLRETGPLVTPQLVDEGLPRHAERDGFTFLLARTGDGRVAGFTYGYRGGPGQWWQRNLGRDLP